MTPGVSRQSWARGSPREAKRLPTHRRLSGIGETYEICGLTVAANVPIPELRPTDTAPWDCFFELLSPRPAAPCAGDWLHHWYLPSGRAWRSCAKRAGSYLLRFHGLADFRVSPLAERITCSPTPGTPRETIRHLLLDQVIPLCLALRGREAVHASAVLTPGGACGFLGDTGSGKSTLAASLVASACALLADDCLALDEADGHLGVLPTYAGLRLWPDALQRLGGTAGSHRVVCHYNLKRRVPVDVIPSRVPSPLQAIFVLSPTSPANDRIAIVRVSAADSLMELTRHSFRLDPTDRAMMARQFRVFGRLVSRVAIYCLTYPRDFSVLPAVREAIFASLA